LITSTAKNFSFSTHICKDALLNYITKILKIIIWKSGTHDVCLVQLPLNKKTELRSGNRAWYWILGEIPPDHLLWNRSPNIGPLVSRWELDIFKNYWNKSSRTSKILTLLYQQFLNLLISKRDMSGPRLGALSNNKPSGGSDGYTVRATVQYMNRCMTCSAIRSLLVPISNIPKLPFWWEHFSVLPRCKVTDVRLGRSGALTNAFFLILFPPMGMNILFLINHHPLRISTKNNIELADAVPGSEWKKKKIKTVGCFYTVRNDECPRVMRF
jgi:hypothetical protein